MRSVGVRELTENMSRILQEVSGGDDISITSDDKEIARLVPPRTGRSQGEMTEMWNRIDRIAEDIGRYPGDQITSVYALREGRE